jgi:glycosyltransferase involved in cell wall biosynthesis
MVASCFPPSIGGIESCVFELSTRLSQQGHHVTVLTSSRGLPSRTYNDRAHQLGHVVRYPERLTFLEVPIIPQIPAKLLLDDKYDVVHIHGMTPTQTDLALIASALRGPRAIYTHHFDPQTRGGHLTDFYSYVTRPILNLAEIITASTLSYANSSKFLQPYLKKVKIIPMGVDSARFEDIHNEPTFESAEEIQSFDARILYVGKLIYYKGLDHLLHAFCKLKANEACLVIVGRGAEREHLNQLAKRLRISDRVFFMGAIPDSQLPSIYAISDVVTLPSVTRREAFGIVILEAMAASKPVVATAIPGVCDVIDNGRTGYLVPPADSNALASALDYLLENRAEARRMGEEGRITVRMHYDWQKVISMYLDLYGNSIQNSEPRCVVQPASQGFSDH